MSESTLHYVEVGHNYYHSIDYCSADPEASRVTFAIVNLNAIDPIENKQAIKKLLMRPLRTPSRQKAPRLKQKPSSPIQ